MGRNGDIGRDAKFGLFRQRIEESLPERVGANWRFVKLRWCAVCQSASSNRSDRCQVCKSPLGSDTINGYGCPSCHRVHLSIKQTELCDHGRPE